MLSFANRFHGHGSLRFLYKFGQAERSRFVTVKHVANKRRHDSRFAVVVSRKVMKRAVHRNRVRRRVYEVIRHEIPKFNGTHDVSIIVVSSELMHLPYDELYQGLVSLFDQAGLYKTAS